MTLAAAYERRNVRFKSCRHWIFCDTNRNIQNMCTVAKSIASDAKCCLFTPSFAFYISPSHALCASSDATRYNCTASKEMFIFFCRRPCETVAANVVAQCIHIFGFSFPAAQLYINIYKWKDAVFSRVNCSNLTHSVRLSQYNSSCVWIMDRHSIGKNVTHFFFIQCTKKKSKRVDRCTVYELARQ